MKNRCVDRKRIANTAKTLAKVFPLADPPDVSEIPAENAYPEERQNYIAVLGGRRWNEFKVGDLTPILFDLALLSTSAQQYYLPAFLLEAMNTDDPSYALAVADHMRPDRPVIRLLSKDARVQVGKFLQWVAKRFGKPEYLLLKGQIEELLP